MNEEKAMEFPDDLKYTREHEWLLVEDKIATIGITDFAQEQLGDVVFVELPAVGDKVTKDEAMGVIESVKAVSDVYAPVSGKVLEVNDDLPESTEMVNEDPYGDGWIARIKIADEAGLKNLMDYAAYQKQCAEETH